MYISLLAHIWEVYSAFPAIWLVPPLRISLYYSPPGKNNMAATNEQKQNGGYILSTVSPTTKKVTKFSLTIGVEVFIKLT
jgi:hypothetical protein